MTLMEYKNRILIIESSEIIKEGLSRIIKISFPDVEVIHHYNLDFLKGFRDTDRLSLMIINSSLILNPSMLSDIKNNFPQSRLIGLMTHFYNRDTNALFDDFIYISDHSETISATVKKILHQPPPKKKTQSEKLTDREFDVLRLLIKGYANKKIADELFISIHTVVTHRKNITTKLGIKSIAGLTIYGIINNIIDVNDYLDTSE